MMDEFVIKDSGVREEFASGMKRDTQAGKTLWALVYSGPMLARWAWHLTAGAVKYGRDNWMQANGQEELDRFRDSAARHFAQWMNGERDEDHASAVFFNINGAEYVRDLMLAEEPNNTDLDAPATGEDIERLIEQWRQRDIAVANAAMVGRTDTHAERASREEQDRINAQIEANIEAANRRIAVPSWDVPHEYRAEPVNPQGL